MKKYAPLKDIESVLPILSKIAIWGGVSDKQQNAIFQRLETGVFQEGEYVFRRGDEPSHIYIVKKGKIELRISTPEVKVEKVMLSEGECFGVASLMAMQKHNTDALALEESEIMVLSRQSLLELQHEDIALFALLMMNTARELARRLKLTDDILLCYMETHKNN